MKVFLSVFISVDDMLGREALVVRTQLIRTIIEKIDEPILHVRGWIKGQITITVARSYSHMIHGAQIPSNLWYREPEWDRESVIWLAH